MHTHKKKLTQQNKTLQLARRKGDGGRHTIGQILQRGKKNEHNYYSRRKVNMPPHRHCASQTGPAKETQNKVRLNKLKQRQKNSPELIALTTLGQDSRRMI